MIGVGLLVVPASLVGYAAYRLWWVFEIDCEAWREWRRRAQAERGARRGGIMHVVTRAPRVSREIVIDPDYRSEDMVWDVRGNSVRIDNLPISAATRQQLIAWQKRWDELAWHDLGAAADRHAVETGWPAETPDGKPAEPIPADVWAQHGREGEAVWVAVLRELGPEWKVGWPATGDDGYWVRWSPDGPAERLR